ncbi:MAG: adenine phosphoribosyltransferase [Anaerolineaceae bacterium]|nr:adenine phosphoribosyltransferase [Anaerolineaceae bacterium]
MSEQTHFAVDIAGIKRQLRLFEIKPGLRIAILNILGDTELVEAAAEELVKKTSNLKFDAIVTAEAKSIPLAYAFSVKSGIPYIILRKAYKPYMGNALQAETLSITTGKPQTLFLDEKDLQLVKGKKILVLDDVISTGSTLEGMKNIIEKAGGKIIGNAAIFTEGDESDWADIISLGHLPLFFN